MRWPLVLWSHSFGKGILCRTCRSRVVFHVTMSSCTSLLRAQVLQLGMQILQCCRDVPTVGHGGCLKTLHWVIPASWWPLVYAKVATYAWPYRVYAQAKRPTQSLSQPLLIPEQPWQIISVDFTVDMPVSQGREAVLVVVDMFTKVSIFVPLKRLPLAPWTWCLFSQHIFCCHGLRGDILRDPAHFLLEATFVSAGVRCSLYNRYHPQSKIQSKQVNQITHHYICCYIVIRMTGFTCCHWQNLPITSVSALPSSRPLFMCNMVHPCDHPAMLGQLSRGFPLRTPISSCSIYICFLRSSWEKHWQIAKAMQIDICHQQWTLWLESMIGCPVNKLCSAFFWLWPLLPGPI